jgi:hypothetical protein
MNDRDLMQQALDALNSPNFGVHSRAISALNERLAHCDRCGKRLGGEGDIHTCTPDPIGDAQDRLIAELAAQPKQEPVAWRLNGESSLGHGKVFGEWKSGKPPKDVADLASVDKNWSLEFASTTPPAAAQPAPDNMSSILSELNALYGKITPPPYFVAPDGRGIGLSGNRWTANGAFQNLLKEGVSRHGGTSADNMRFICSVVNSWTQISVMLATPPAAAPVQGKSYAADGQTELHTLSGVGLVVSAVAFNKLYTTKPAAAQPTMFGPMGTVGALFDKHVIGGLDKNWRVYVEKR